MRLSLAAALLLVAAPAAAAEPAAEDRPTSDARGASPDVAYAFTTGSTDGTFGAQAYGLGVVARGQSALLGGGASAWGTVGRFTLLGDASRDMLGRFAPSAGTIVRLAGDPTRGVSFGALGRYKVEGFGVGPNGEIESEMEGGLVLSVNEGAWHLDANAIGGAGLGDAGEIDLEARLRAGRDVGSFLRVGLDGQARTGMGASRTRDFTGGPQLIVGSGSFFGAVTAGPTTVGIAKDVGWTALVTLGGVRL